MTSYAGVEKNAILVFCRHICLNLFWEKKFSYFIGNLTKIWRNLLNFDKIYLKMMIFSLILKFSGQNSFNMLFWPTNCDFLLHVQIRKNFSWIFEVIFRKFGKIGWISASSLTEQDKSHYWAVGSPRDPNFKNKKIRVLRLGS